MFTEELNFFIANQDQLVKEHAGKVLVLQGNRILGVYPDVISAYLEAQKEHALGTFMIQHCVPGPEAYSVTITSTTLGF